jgi:chromosome segregation ATPase
LRLDDARDDGIVVVARMETVMSHEWLERIERKIDAQGKEQQRMAAVLDLHTDMLQEHGRRLDRHEALLEAQSRQLEAHGQALEAHDRRFESLDRRLDGQDKDLRRIGVLLEEVKADIWGVAEGVTGLNERIDREFKEVRTLIEDRTWPLEAASRDHASKLADHERRLPKRAQRKKR